MAIRRDWFKRQVEILAQALGTALGLKEKGDLQAALAETEAAFQKAFGAGGALALGLPLEDFLSLVCRGEEPSPEFLTELSKLFAQWAELLTAAGRTAEAHVARTRSDECGAIKG